MASRKSNKGTTEDQDHNSGAAMGDEADAERDFASEVLGGDSPEGFRRVNPLDGARAYFKPEAGAKVRGILLGRFKRTDSDDEDGGDKFYYQIRLSADCDHVVDGEGNKIPGIVGLVVHFDERSGVRDLEPIALIKKPQEVVCQAIEKIKLKRSKGSFWRWGVYAREAPTATLARVAAAAKEIDAANGAEDPFA